MTYKTSVLGFYRTSNVLLLDPAAVDYERYANIAVMVYTYGKKQYESRLDSAQ